MALSKARGDTMPISFGPMRKFMEDNHISYYRLANAGMDAQTLQRIRHDKPITTETLGKLCFLLQCQPGELVEYVRDESDAPK